MTENNAAKAVQEAERIAAADEYFKARAWLMDTNDNRRIFEAGFDRAYALLSKLRAEGVQAGDERAAFEAWAATEIPAHKLGRAPWPHEDQYNWASMEYAWSIWRKIRAALASAPAASEAVRLLRKIREDDFLSDTQRHRIDRLLASAPVAGEAHRIFLVPTGEVYCGQETYTRHEGQPPVNTDNECLYAAPQASEAARNAALEEAAHALVRMDVSRGEVNAIVRAVEIIRALKAQADKDGGDCAKGGEYEDLLALMERAAREAGGSQWVAEGFESRTPGAAFYGGLIMNADGETVVAQCVNESNASHMMSSSPANVLWLIRQYRAALSPTQPTEQGERDGDH